MFAIKSASGDVLNPFYNNFSGSADGFFQFDKTNSLSGMLIYSSNSKGNDRCMAGYGQYLHTTNAVQAYWTESIVTKNYQNEIGFVSRQDVICTTPGFVTNLRGKMLPFKKWARAFQPDAAAEFYQQASTGKLIESNVAVYPFWVLLHSGGFFGYSFTLTYQYLTEDFNPLQITIAKGEYKYTRHTFYIYSDPSKKLSYNIVYDAGKYFNGTLSSPSLSLGCSPIPQILMKFSVAKNNFKTIGIKDTSANVSLYTFEGKLAMNPRLQLNSLVQYNNQNKATVFNIRLSWEYKPISYLFFVFNRRNMNATQTQLQQGRIVKLSYLKQF